MLVDVAPALGTFDHHCAHCGAVTRGLRIDPARGDLIIARLDGVAVNLVTRPCPNICHCADHAYSGVCGTIEAFRLAIAPHEAGEGTHPHSLVGTRFPDTGGIVTAHDVDGALHPHHQEQARYILALARHPQLAPRLGKGA